MTEPNPSIEFICHALNEYAATMAPTARMAFTAFANKHVENIKTELAHRRPPPSPVAASPETKF